MQALVHGAGVRGAVLADNGRPTRMRCNMIQRFDVGARLSAVRKMHHMSQRALAKRAENYHIPISNTAAASLVLEAV